MTTGQVSEALRLASTEKDQWHVDHQGPIVDIIGHVWWCGDDDCDCTEARITARFRNLADARWIVPRTLWQGEFHTDGESGASDELIAKRAHLEATEPEIAARITWHGIDDE